MSVIEIHGLKKFWEIGKFAWSYRTLCKEFFI